KTFIAPAPARAARRGRLYVGWHVLPASQAVFAFALAARATVESRCNSVRARFAANAIFAGHLAGPTADPIASDCHDTLAHARGRPGTKRRDDPTPRGAARLLPRRGAPRGGDDHAVGGVDRRVAEASRRHPHSRRRRQDRADARPPRQARRAG